MLGTSLGGLYADDVAVETALRSRTGRSLGACMINLQQTEQDGKMSLRLFGRSDEVMRLLLAELGMGKPRFQSPVWPAERKVLVPYDAQGRRIEEGDGRRMWWDLSDRANVRITPGHNIQGARQPCYLHIGGKDRKYKGVQRKAGPGVGRVTARNEQKACYELTIEGAKMRLGLWWIEAAVHGRVARLPIVNVRPSYEVGAEQ